MRTASTVGEKKSEVAFNFDSKFVKIGEISFSRGKNLPFGQVDSRLWVRNFSEVAFHFGKKFEQIGQFHEVFKKGL